MIESASTAARMLFSVSNSSRSGPPVDASRCSSVIGGDENQLNGPIESNPLYVQVSVTAPNSKPA